MKLSICIPVYRVAPYIERCARSLFEQTYEDLEYVFVDDCSPDESLAILRRVTAEYPARTEQVRLVRHERNAGLVQARMTGLAAATGELVTHCDPDDWVDPDYYRTLVRRLEETEADMVFSTMLRNEDEKLHGDYGLVFEGSGADYLRSVGRIMAFNSNVNKVYRRAIATAPDIELPTHIRIGEDLCRTVQTVIRCRKVVSAPGVNYHYRDNGASMTRDVEVRRIVDDLAAVYAVLSHRVTDPAADPVKCQLVNSILFWGLKYTTLTPAEFRTWHARLKAMGGRFESADASRLRALLMRLAEFSYPLAAALNRLLSRKAANRI